MFRIACLTTVLLLAAGSAARAQLPPQPPPVALPQILPSAGDERERAACRPDVQKYCKQVVDLNPDDALGILGCLQRNRQTISVACNTVLRSHGQ